MEAKLDKSLKKQVHFIDRGTCMKIILKVILEKVT
jgi:hypothetical protein